MAMTGKVREIVSERAESALREAFQGREGLAAAEECARSFAALADTATVRPPLPPLPLLRVPISLLLPLLSSSLTFCVSIADVRRCSSRTS